MHQFIFGKDFFGFEPIGRRLSGPFGDELIAGGYLQRFSIFSFFLIPLFFNKLNNNNKDKNGCSGENHDDNDNQNDNDNQDGSKDNDHISP